MGRSLLLPVKQEFVRLLQELPDVADVQVSFGHPGENELEHEAIWINETVEWTQEVAVMGPARSPIQEKIGFAVRFLAALPGQFTAEEAETRVVDLFEAAQDIVRDQSNFADLRSGRTGSQLTSIALVPSASTPMFGADGRVSVINATLRAEGRI